MLTPILPSSRIIRKKQIHAKSWECTVMGCDRKFRYPCQLKRHTDYLHEKIYHNVCEHVENGEKCGKKFAKASGLTQHKKSHYPELKLKCDCCTRRFQYQSDLQNHMDFVAGFFYNVCDYIDDNGKNCGKTFELAGALTKHKNIHIRDAQRDMAPMEDHHVSETHHTVQSWE